MPTPEQIQQAINKIGDQSSFIHELLVDALGWPIQEEIEDLDEIAFEWTAEELNAEDLDRNVMGGRVFQIQPLRDDQPWGIFILEFSNEDAFTTGRGLTGPLRKVLRGLVPKRRRGANLPAWEKEHLLFVCTHQYHHFRFAYFKSPVEKGHAEPLITFGWGPDIPARTAYENLAYLEWPDTEVTPDRWVSNWTQAFDVEKVTKKFYREYAEVFQTVEELIRQSNEIRNNELRLFTQILFNRLMFLRFIERKGWLQFGESTNYLSSLHVAGGIGDDSFYKSRLQPLFFEALAIEGRQESETVGKVPFLNGGLFEKDKTDEQVTDIPDEAFDPILGERGLFYRYNFTVEESTPLDIEVAVDPEMLGKVFEELVTGRHETGSYYTPKPVVSFMCKEALKAFLYEKTSAPKEALEKLVDEHEITEGLTERHAQEILFYLDTMKACDPACGSGAYLLGLLQELIAIRRCLQHERLRADPAFLYKLKLGIIRRSLYGVDIDDFATNVAKLRLWLSLAVESEQPEPLPNLDFKIETGDSVLGPCTPFITDETALMMEALRQRANQLVLKKDRFMVAHGDEKQTLYSEIKAEEKAIAEETATAYGEGVIAWHIHFAEVFISTRRQREIDSSLVDIGTFEVTTYEPGGFDIVLANPPYIRQELIKELKPRLREIFPDTFTSTADLYTYFYARAVEMLAPSGVLSFISSNKWFRAAYGKKLRKYVAEKCRVISITDFLDSPVFESATSYPMIFIAQKTNREIKTVYTETRVPGPSGLDVLEVIRNNGRMLATSSIRGEDWSFADENTAEKIEKMKSVGVPIEDYLGEKLYIGIKTGYNKAFIIKSSTREKLIEEDPASEDIIKPLVMGRDIRRWNIEDANLWIIFARRGCNIKDFPAIEKYLAKYKTDLLPKPPDWSNSKPWPGRKAGTYKWYEIQDNVAYYEKFETPKILFPDISPEPRFALDLKKKYYPDMTAFMIPSDDLFLLGVLNSKVVLEFYSQITAQIRGGYLRYKSQYVKQIPIPTALDKDKKAVEELVKKCLNAKGKNCEKWEKEIDKIVTKLYGLEG